MVPDLTYNVADLGTSYSNGQSTVKLATGASYAAGAGQFAFHIVRVANDPLNSDNTAVNSNVIVRFAPGSIMSVAY